MRSPSPGRMLCGFAVVPLVAVLVAMATYELFWHVGFLLPGGPIHSIDAAQAMFGGLTIIAVPMTVAAAVPGVLWLKDSGSLTLGRLVLLGAALGNLPFALIVIGIIAAQLARGTPVAEIGRYWYGASGFVVNTATGVLAGAGSAAAFWLVAFCGTTDAERGSSLPTNVR